MKNPLLKSIKDIEKQVGSLNKRKYSIQRKCPHPEKTLIKEYASNTGNYDPSADYYWVNLTCLRCGKHWSYGNDVKEYREYSLKRCMVMRDGKIHENEDYDSKIIYIE